MKLDDLFPLIVVLLIIFVTLIRAIARALSASQKTRPAGRPPSAWEEFKKAFQSLAQEAREPGRAEEELKAEEPPQVLIEEEGAEGEREVIVVAPVRRGQRRMAERFIRPAPQPVPQVQPAPAARHRPEELGARIAEEVKDIIHPGVEEHLRQRGLMPLQPGELATHRPPAAAMLLIFAGDVIVPHHALKSSTRAGNSAR